MSIYSSYWYKVAETKPKLHSHAKLLRHTYRGKTWYIMQDTVSGKMHRFDKAAYFIIANMDGQATLQDIWESGTSAFGDEALTQNEIIQLLGQLHWASVLQTDMPPDTKEMFDRRKQQRRKKLQQRLNPFSIRLPLADPNHFLARWTKLVEPLYRRTFFFFWLLVVGAASLLTLLHWPELTHDVADRVLTPTNLTILWLVFPVVKVIHELGHAFAIRIWGGEVHEMGIMLLAFTPVPYVEATAAAAFTDKYKRMAVSAAGMMVELFLASLALFVWLNVENGTVKTIAYNVMLIGGVSTLLFNGNPLMRFDGYYLLADWLEIPNLAKRSSSYLGYLLQAHLFRMEQVQSPITAKGERHWFVVYGLASFCYRLFVIISLSLFISSRFFIVGILLAVWGLTSQLLMPGLHSCYRFVKSASATDQKTRVLASVAAVAGLFFALLFVVPVPLTTSSQGVVAVPENSRIRAGADCFISGILVADSSQVQQGQTVMLCQDPLLGARINMLEANLKEAEAAYQAEPLQSRVQREILKDKITEVRADLDFAKEQSSQLTITSPATGTFILAEKAELLQGRFVHQGDQLGYILGNQDSHLVVVVSQADIGLVQKQTKEVAIRLASDLQNPFTTNLGREIPAASNQLPSAILGSAAGGPIAVDPGDADGTTTLTQTFQYEIQLSGYHQNARIGERAYVLFKHGYQPLAGQGLRAMRQLFLRHFNL